jgi:peptidyl-prolyl cis-trans isomerase A (cyclophilin A)
MTLVKRKLKQSPFRLIRAFFLIAGILTVALVLYELDAFHDKRRQRTSPEQVLLTQEQQKLLRGNNAPIEHEEENVPPEPPQEPKEGHRRFVMTLAGLTGAESRHDILIETREDWAPIGVEHFHKLVEKEVHFYDLCRFFRVVPNFVVQFGIAADPALQRAWKETVLQDDPVQNSNKRGTISFATSGPNTRTTQLFINTGDNGGLDHDGFSPIGQVLDDGMEWVDRINAEHRQTPNQGKIQNRGNEYLQEEFPDLSYIESIRSVNDIEDDDKLLEAELKE